MPSANALEDFVGAMTLRDLAQQSGLSVASIVAHAARGSKSPEDSATRRSAAAPTNGAPAKRQIVRVRKGGVDTRTAVGRQAYEAAVLGVVTDATDAVSASDVRAAAGGTALQARATLNRLIQSGAIRYKGKARGTRYFT